MAPRPPPGDPQTPQKPSRVAQGAPKVPQGLFLVTFGSLRGAPRPPQGLFLATFGPHVDNFGLKFWIIFGCFCEYCHCGDNRTTCFETLMTPLSDTHARAWKIEGVIDKLARAIKERRASRSHDKLGLHIYNIDIWYI